MSEVFTVGRLAEALGESQYRITYALERGRIAPAARAGVIRLFTEAQIPQIREVLRQIDRAPQSLPARQARAAARAQAAR